jgi:hypothetical protein
MGGPEQLPQDDFEQGFAGSMSRDMTEAIFQGQTSTSIAVTGRFDREAKFVQIRKPRNDLYRGPMVTSLFCTVMLPPNSGMGL